VGKEGLVVHLIERIPEHFDEQEVEDIGRVYRWCPEYVVVECDACGRRTTLLRSDLISRGFDCECGKDNAAIIREEVVLQLIDEDYDAHHHPWCYWDNSEDTKGLASSKTSIPSCQQCGHDGLMMVDHVEGGYVSQCLMCERWGPIGQTPEQARQLLMDLGAERMRPSAANVC
jgi:hypothetical protein